MADYSCSLLILPPRKQTHRDGAYNYSDIPLSYILFPATSQATHLFTHLTDILSAWTS
jgi:hypothetical protein